MRLDKSLLYTISLLLSNRPHHLFLSPLHFLPFLVFLRFHESSFSFSRFLVIFLLFGQVLSTFPIFGVLFSLLSLSSSPHHFTLLRILKQSASIDTTHHRIHVFFSLVFTSFFSQSTRQHHIRPDITPTRHYSNTTFHSTDRPALPPATTSLPIPIVPTYTQLFLRHKHTPRAGPLFSFISPFSTRLEKDNRRVALEFGPDPQKNNTLHPETPPTKKLKNFEWWK